MDIQLLRRETEADHRAVEGTVDLMRADLTPQQYVASLQSFYGIVSAWEQAAEAAAPDWLQPELAERRRTPLLVADLAHFGATPSANGTPVLPSLGTLPQLLGAMYVMEGSTLGGQFIARHVDTVLHLTKGEGSAYFRGHGSNTGAMWRRFADIIAGRVTESDAVNAVTSAKAMFAAFGAWMKQTTAQEIHAPHVR